MSITPKLLLTGGNGMVGRNILDHPGMRNWQVLAPRRDELNLTDWLAVSSFFREHRIDAVIHAAGQVGGIQANIDNPLKFLDANLQIGRNLIMAAHESGVARLLNLSSSCVYPTTATNPLTEDMILTGPFEPTNEGYALAKVAAMKLCEYIVRTFPGRQYKTIVPCNQYGFYDHFDSRTAHLIPAIIHKVHTIKSAGQRQVEIWGTGKARREFMFAGDLADAVVKALDDIDDLPPVMNIGVGQDYSIDDYYSIVAEVLEWEGEFVHDTSRPEGMFQKLCSTELQMQWGWSPSTNLHDGLAITYRHYLEAHR